MKAHTKYIKQILKGISFCISNLINSSQFKQIHILEILKSTILLVFFHNCNFIYLFIFTCIYWSIYKTYWKKTTVAVNIFMQLSQFFMAYYAFDLYTSPWENHGDRLQVSSTLQRLVSCLAMLTPQFATLVFLLILFLQW